MQVRVKLFATLKEYAPVNDLPGTPFDIEVPVDIRVSELMQILKLPEDTVKITFVNGIIQHRDWVLKPGDEIGIFPPIGGGSYVGKRA